MSRQKKGLLKFMSPSVLDKSEVQLFVGSINLIAHDGVIE